MKYLLLLFLTSCGAYDTYKQAHLDTYEYLASQRATIDYNIEQTILYGSDMVIIGLHYLDQDLAYCKELLEQYGYTLRVYSTYNNRINYTVEAIKKDFKEDFKRDFNDTELLEILSKVFPEYTVKNI